MDRREFVVNAGVLAAAVATSKLAFGETKTHEHHHAPANQGLAGAAYTCVNKGEVCLQHCMDYLSKGDTALAACAQSVREMLVLCGALAQAASQNSKHLKSLAKIALDACKACEDECRKHAKQHATCKDCADACADCAKQCKATLA